MEVIRSSKTFVLGSATRRHIPEDGIFQGFVTLPLCPVEEDTEMTFG
jgi:hypothetical protein